MRKRLGIAAFLVPLAAGAAAALLSLSGPGDAAGLRIYDALLRLRSPGAFPREILLVEAEDATAPGVWDGIGMAEGIAALAELGARYVVLPSASSLGPPAGSGAELADAVESELGTVDANVAALFDAIRLGSVSPKDSPRYVAELLKTIDAGKARLLAAAAGAGRVGRERLAGALRLQGRAYLAFDPLSDGSAGAELASSGARGAGYAPLMIDPDGARRRLAIVSRRRAGGYGHPAFAALLDRLDGPAMATGSELAEGGDFVVLRGASIHRKNGDIPIPLSREGLLIEWPRPGSGIPRRLPWGELGRAAILEDELAQALDGLAKAGLIPAGAGLLRDLREHAGRVGEEALRGSSSLEAWREARERYFERAAMILSAGSEAALLAATRAGLLDAASEEEATALRHKADRIESGYAGARETQAELSMLRARLKRELAGSFCIVAPARAAEGLRPDPYGEEASEGLASAAAVGSILSERFLRELPPLLGAALGAFLALAVAVASAWLGKRWAALEGGALALLAVAACVLVFAYSGNYLSPLGPALGPLAAAVAALFAKSAVQAPATSSSPDSPLSGRSAS